MVSEIQAIKALWHRPFIELADDNTFANRAHGKRLVRAMAKEHVRWFTETDISIAEDEELLAMLRDSGCAQVLIGFEHPTRRGVEGLEQKANWKARQVDGYLEAIERIQRHGISVNGCFILGLDGTGEESFDDVLNFVDQSGLYEVQVTLQTPFPGTPLYDRLLRKGRLLEPTAWERCTLFDVNFEPEGMSATTLAEGFRKLVGNVYSDARVQARRKAFQTQLRAAPRSALT